MRNIGVVRPIDELGRIVIPMEFRKVLGISAKDQLEISLSGSTISIRKYDKSCILCGETGDFMEFGDKIICINCLKKLRSI